MRIFKNLVESSDDYIDDKTAAAKAYNWLKANYDTASEHDIARYERIVAKSADWSYEYAVEVLDGGQFKLGESAIAESAEFSYWYANRVLGEPFKLGEPAIIETGWDGDFDEDYSFNSENLNWSWAVNYFNFIINVDVLPSDIYLKSLIQNRPDLFFIYHRHNHDVSHLFDDFVSVIAKDPKYERDVILLNDELTHKYIMTVYKDVYPRRADLMKDDLGITDPVHRYIAAYISNLPIRGGITGDPEIEALYKQEIL